MKKIILLLISVILTTSLLACSPNKIIEENEITYRITLNLLNKEASCEIEFIDIAYGEKVILPTPILVGHTFIGWKIKGSGEKLVNGQEYCFKKNIELIPIWSPNSYRITLDLASPQATCSCSYIDVIYGETVSLPTPFLLDNTFIKWIVKGSNETFINGSVYTFKTNIELKAIWSSDWSFPV